MSNLTAVDADGHIIEKENDIRKYLQQPWNRRYTALRPGDQPWDNHMFDTFQSERIWGNLSAREQIARWHELMDEHQMETAVCFPTGSGSIVRLQELPFQIAVARACNDHFAAEYNALSDRVKCVGVLPMRSPQAAAEELERAAKELGIIGFEILPPGLTVALGDTFYDPVYAAAEKYGAVLGIHGTRNWSREFGAEGLNTFAEVHAYAFTAGILLQFTSMICQGVPVRFPKLRMAFLEIGATWLPYYLDRLDEHWEKRAEYEMPLLKEKPSDLVRKSEVYFSIESGESQLAHTIEYVGAEHFVYASDIPHWDCEFPENLEQLRNHQSLSPEVKEMILFKNAKRLFKLRGGIMKPIKRPAHPGRSIPLLLVALLFLVCPPPAAALEEVIISYAGPSITFLPAEIARQRNFFREQNLDVKLLLTRSEVDRAALASGNVDYTLRAGSTFVSAARGLPVKIVLLGTMRPFWGLVVRPEVKSVTELKGKSMAVPGLLGSQQISAKFILKKYGLDPDRDVIYRVVETGTRIPAMLSGTVDCSMMDYGEAFRAKKAGFKMLINAADVHGLVAGGLGVNLKKLKDQPDQVRRVIKALVEALKYVQENPEGTQQVMMSWLKLEHEMAADIYQMARNSYTKNGTMEEATLNSLVTAMLAEANIKNVSPSQLVDFSLLHQVLK